MSPIGKYLLTFCDDSMFIDLWADTHFNACRKFGISAVMHLAKKIGVFHE